RLLSRCGRRKPRGHLNILHVPPRTRLPEMRMILWPLADVHTGRSGVVEEWHRPVGGICARRSAPERFPACSSFLCLGEGDNEMSGRDIRCGWARALGG